MEIFDRPVFVAGLPRSGTSMIAGCLQQCGVWMGTTVPGGKPNPKGFFEHIVIREKVVKPLLAAMECDPLGIRMLPPPDFDTDITFNDADGTVRRLRDVLRAVIDSDGYEHDRLWGYKDAKLTHLWPLFVREFPSANWLIVRRSKESFVNSCLNTHFMVQHSSDPNYWLEVADGYNLRLENLLGSEASVMEVNVEDIVKGEYTQLENFMQMASIEFSEQKIKDFVEIDHWHH